MIDPNFDTFSISVDPDGMPHYEIFHLHVGLHYLPKYAFIGITIINKDSNAVVGVWGVSSSKPSCLKSS